MDNLCHSLVGAALSAAGLRRRTGLATVTMVIGANLPDVDAIVYVVGGGTTALAFRRGWTHGLLAMVVLPIVLAGLMTVVGRFLEARRADRPKKRLTSPVVPSQLLLISAIAVWTHPIFDLFNTYGVRLLMPFSSRWFYGDTLFIIDPWIWLALGIGTLVSLRRARAVPVGAASPTVMARAERPARLAVMAVATYIALMAATSLAGRAIVERQAVAAGRPPSRRVMVSPQPATPLIRGVIRDLGDSYEAGQLSWTIPPKYTPFPTTTPVQLDTRPARAAAVSRDGRQFLSWSRFPFVMTEGTGAGATLVRLSDARYAGPGGRSWAAVDIIVRDTSVTP